MHCEEETGARVLLGMGRRGRVKQVWQRLSRVRSTGPGLAWHCLLRRRADPEHLCNPRDPLSEVSFCLGPNPESCTHPTSLHTPPGPWRGYQWTWRGP